MPRKMLIGFAAVAIACLLFGSGYRFGQYLAQHDAADVNDASPAPAPAASATAA